MIVWTNLMSIARAGSFSVLLMQTLCPGAVNPCSIGVILRSCNHNSDTQCIQLAMSMVCSCFLLSKTCNGPGLLFLLTAKCGKA